MNYLCNNIHMARKKSFRIYFNAPITLTFVGICFLALLLDFLTDGSSTYYVFSTYGSNLLNPLTYVRLLCHVFGHDGLSHLLSNLLYILLLGPILEEKYHDRLWVVIVTTAITTGILHNIFEPNVILLGSSGIVFAFILLASITGKENGIPVTLILVALLWLGQEIVSSINAADNISQITHIVGGLSGAILGMVFKDR